MSELTELERAVVEASVVYFDCQIDLFFVDWCDAVERLALARTERGQSPTLSAAQGRTR